MAVRHTVRPVLLAALAVLVACVLVPGPAAAAPVAAAAGLDHPCDATPETPGQARCLVVQRSASRPPARSGDAAPAVSSDLTPAGWQSVYGVSGLTPPAGATVGIVVAFDAPNLLSDLSTYRASYGLPACLPTNGCYQKLTQRGAVVPENGVGPGPVANTGWALETTLDTQAVSAVCPGCRLVVVEADSASFTNLGQAVLAAQRAGATVIGNSFGGLESSGTPSTASIDQTYWSRVTVPVFAASGDDAWNNNADTTANAGRGPLYPATSPSVVAVGGTSGPPAADGSGQTAWSYAGSGCSYVFRQPSAQSAYFAATGTAPGTDIACANSIPRKAEADLSALADPNAPGFRLFQQANPNGNWSYVGGTSLAAQLVAAVAAYAGPRPAGSSVTDVAWRLAAAGASTGLLDVTSGSNDASGGTCGATAVCTAGAGWDGPTGLGTPRGPQLFAPLLTVPPGVRNTGSQVTVSGSNLLPGEDAVLTSATTSLGSAVVAADGTWTATVPVPSGSPTVLPVTVTGSTSGLTATRAVALASAAVPATIGVSRVENGARVFYLASQYSDGGGKVTRVAFGNADDVPTLRPNAQGVCVPGVYRDSTATFFQASDAVNGGGTVTATQFGNAGDRPVLNDPGLTASGDSVLTLRRPPTATFYSRVARNPANGPPQVTVGANPFGNATDVGFALRQGATVGTSGVYRPGSATFYVENPSGVASDPVTTQQFGAAGDQGLVGRWIAPTNPGDPGSEYVGVFRPAQGRFFLAQRPLVVDGTPQAPQVDVRSFSFGSPGDTAVSCDAT